MSLIPPAGAPASYHPGQDPSSCRSHARPEAGFPLWEQETRAVAREFLRAGFRAVGVRVDLTRREAPCAGREFDEAFVEVLPARVDPCGENAKFHTFVYEGPIFTRPVTFRSHAHRP